MARPEDLSNYRHPDQAPLVWGDLQKPWEQVVTDGPDWQSGQFPPRPERSEYQGKYHLGGLELCSPITIAAGPASGQKWTDFYFNMGFSLVFEKTRRTVPRVSNAAPNIAIVRADTPITRETIGRPLQGSLDQREWVLYESMTNSFGNPSPDITTWAHELRRQRQSVGEGQLLGCSVTATTPGDEASCMAILGQNPEAAVIIETASDLLAAATAAATNGAQVIELNLACPNVTEHPQEGEMFQSPELVAYTTARFKQMFPNVPVGIKFGLYTSQDQMRRVFVAAGDNLDFVSGINAVATHVVGEDGNDILPGRRQTGVAGRADQHLALESIRWAAQVREQEGLHYQIIGGGGIIHATDVDRYQSEGADLVFVAAAALANPLLAYQYRISH